MQLDITVGVCHALPAYRCNARGAVQICAALGLYSGGVEVLGESVNIHKELSPCADCDDLAARDFTPYEMHRQPEDLGGALDCFHVRNVINCIVHLCNAPFTIILYLPVLQKPANI